MTGRLSLVTPAGDFCYYGISFPIVFTKHGGAKVNKRPLDNRELRFVIQDAAVRDDGGLAPRARLHVGRIGAATGTIVALACGAGPEPRYVYQFLTMFPWASAFMCQTCAKVLRAELEGRSDAAWTDAPASNTGANSQ